MMEKEKEATLLLVHNETIKAKRIYGIYNIEPTTICVEIKTSSWSLMKQLEVMSHLQIIQRLSLKEKGMILIKLKDGSHQFTSDVYYILTVKKQHIELGQLLNKGYEIKMKDRTLTLRDTKGAMIAKVVMIKNKCS